LQLDLLGASSFAVRSIGGTVFCGSIRWGRRLLRFRHLRFNLLGALSFWFDPLGASSFAVRSVVGAVFCGTIRLGRRLLQYDQFGALSFAVGSVWGVIFLV
jgi:hypothetical protein